MVLSSFSFILALPPTHAGGRARPTSSLGHPQGLTYCHQYWGHKMRVCSMNTLPQELHHLGRGRSGHKMCYFHLYRLSLRRGDGGYGSKGRMTPPLKSWTLLLARRPVLALASYTPGWNWSSLLLVNTQSNWPSNLSAKWRKQKVIELFKSWTCKINFAPT